MRILFLHGWNSVPGGRKPTSLKDHGHDVVNPALPDEDFEQAVAIAQAAFDEHRPDVIVGSSRGGAVAMSIESADTPLVLLCPAWKRWGSATTVKANSTILHARADDVIPFADSVELAGTSGLPESALIEVSRDHRLVDSEPLARMLSACEASVGLSPSDDLVEVTVYHLEMRDAARPDVPAPRDGLTVMHVPSPTVAYYRFLYDAVGQDYSWLSRRKLSDSELSDVLLDQRNELHVLHVDGSPAGFTEFDHQPPDEIELVQFGLMSEFIGQGLGKWFLQWTIDKAWSYEPSRFWLHTCTLDHVAALPNYQQAGFELFKKEVIHREL